MCEHAYIQCTHTHTQIISKFEYVIKVNLWPEGNTYAKRFPNNTQICEPIINSCLIKQSHTIPKAAKATDF